MTKRSAKAERRTKETDIRISLALDGDGTHDIDSGIPFFDHMLTLFTVHGFFNLTLSAKGDLQVDFHHTVEDIGLVLGDAFGKALGDRAGIVRFGHAVTPMDDALAAVTVDLSNRPYLVFNAGLTSGTGKHFDAALTKEFFRAFTTRCGLNLHINVSYGENEHHVLEAIFKATGRAISRAASVDSRIRGVRSTKGSL
ncbi:MAG: imidazoleglycerol-phosphate dehydratase [Deltaproteobacteria bacterium SG8_13]|nr:MAG: imidazoleglycerol-phosphate dehydratase [Deltaproteobacteria bacterium SG8_13]